MSRIGPAGDTDRYELVELRGSGGEGQLWRGTIDVDGAPIPVAIKIVHPSRVDEIDEWRERWQRQAELLRSLDHPGLVKVRDVFEGPVPHDPGEADASTNTLFLVMNWVDGPTLNEWVDRHPERDVLDCSKVLGRLASAIDYLHLGAVTGVPVIHRDIKPANVIVSDTGPVLVDFGFTRVDGGQQMTWAGTPNYVAPEVLREGEFSPASDRYALGATAFFVLTGETPSADRAAMATQLMDVSGAEGRGDIADHVLSMMADDPSARPSAVVPWAQELAAASVSDATLVAATRTRGASDTPPPVPPESRPDAPDGSEPRRRRRLAVGAIALLLVAAGVGALIALSGSGSSESDAAADTDPAPTEATEAEEAEPEDEEAEPEDEEAEAAVVATEPAATEAATTTQATTTIIPSVIVPDVLGLLADEAAAAVEAEGLTATVLEEEGTTPFGAVTAMSHEPDDEAEPGEEVTLIISKPPAELPDVVGKRRTQALNALDVVGVTATITEVLEEGVSDEVVLTQTPEAGSPYATEVALSIGQQPDIVYLADMKSVDRDDLDIENGQVDVNGEIYTRSKSLRSHSGGRPGFAEYDLGRDFLTLRGVIGLRDDEESDARTKVEIYADGVPVYDETLGLGETKPIELDIKNVLRLRLQITDVDENRRSQWVAFADTRLIGPPGAAAGVTEE